MEIVHCSYDVPGWIGMAIHFYVGPECTTDVLWMQYGHGITDVIWSWYYGCNMAMACIFFQALKQGLGLQGKYPKFYMSFSGSFLQGKGRTHHILVNESLPSCPMSVWLLSVWPAPECPFCFLFRLAARAQTSPHQFLFAYCWKLLLCTIMSCNESLPLLLWSVMSKLPLQWIVLLPVPSPSQCVAHGMSWATEHKTWVMVMVMIMVRIGLQFTRPAWSSLMLCISPGLLSPQHSP